MMLFDTLVAFPKTIVDLVFAFWTGIASAVFGLFGF